MTSIVLRSITSQDSSALQELNERPEVVQRIGRMRPTTTVESIERAIDLDGEMAGVVVLVRSGAYDGKDVELVCGVRRHFEGKGIASSACQALILDQWKQVVGGRILACIEPTNSEGRRLAARLGFVDSGDRRPYSGEEVWTLQLPPPFHRRSQENIGVD